jgi:hypothetical protein
MKKNVVSIVLICALAAFGQWQLPSGGGGVGSVAGPNPSASSVTAVTSLTINLTSLNLTSTNSLVKDCWTGTGTARTQVPITSVSALSLTSITLNFTSTANVSCAVNATGGAGPAGANGSNGTNGTNGTGYAATSTSSLLIGTGAKTFVTQAGLAYVIGSRIKATSAANSANWMQGVVSSYSGTSLAATIDLVGGSGTFADWTITIYGDKGDQGIQGLPGANGTGTGTVTVVGAGNLTSTNCVTGGGTQTIQTPTGCTVDATGNAAFKSVTAGDGTVVGEVELPELATNGTNFVSWLAPNLLSANLRLRFPNTQPTDGQMMRFGVPSGTISDFTWVYPTSKIWLPVAGCQGTTAFLLWDSPAASPAVAACAGSNVHKGYADFANGSNLSLEITLKLANDFVAASGLDANFTWLTTTSVGSAVWQLSAACVAGGETDDPTYTNVSEVVSGAVSPAGAVIIAGMPSVNITGCAPNEILHVKVFRDSGHAMDDLLATARLIGVELTVRRAF